MSLCNNLTFKLALVLLLTSCNHKLPTTTTASSQIKDFSRSKPYTTQVPPAPQLPLANSVRKLQPKFINVSVHEINAREFFMGLVMDSQENIVVHPEVSGTISLNLKNVTLAEVLDIVEKVYGYECKKTSAGYIVYPATLQTKIFKIDRLDLLRQGRTNTLVSSGQNTNNNYQQGNYNQQGGYNNQSNNNVTPTNNQTNPNNPQNTQANSSWIKTSTETDFWQELDTALHTIVSIDPQATVIINRQSGMVVVRAKPMQLNEVEKFINATQNQISRQVLLEAKILEVILDESHQDGVNWKVVYDNGVDSIGLLTGFGAASPDKFAAIFTLGSKNGDFSAMVELLSAQGKTNVLSSPRIATLNNQKAIIKVGRDEYFVTGVSSNTVAAESYINGVYNTSMPTANLASFFSGIALDVTPQIDDHENVTLHIHPSISRVENLDKSFTIYGEDYSLPTPLNTVRESDSIVKARDGQVVVLGGLMQETEAEDQEGVSGFAAIPYFGRFFRVDKGKKQKSELIVLLKATIVNTSLDWKPDLDSSQQRFEQLESRPLWK